MYGKARYTVRTFAIRRNEKISTSVTIRGEKAMQLLEAGLKVRSTCLQLPHSVLQHCSHAPANADPDFVALACGIRCLLVAAADQRVTTR